MTKTFLLISRVEFISESNFNCLRCKIKNKIEKWSKMTARLSSVKPNGHGEKILKATGNFNLQVSGSQSLLRYSQGI